MLKVGTWTEVERGHHALGAAAEFEQFDQIQPAFRILDLRGSVASKVPTGASLATATTFGATSR